jgi:hypothetical protein
MVIGPRAGWPAALPARPGALGGHPQRERPFGSRPAGGLSPGGRIRGVAVGLGAEIRLGAICRRAAGAPAASAGPRSPAPLRRKFIA